MNVFSFGTYKEFFRAYIAENKQKGLISQMALDCGCDRTYLSQVLNGKADLTPDHLVQFCDRLQFKEVESRYLMLLLLRDRASSIAARKSFDSKLQELKVKQAVLTKKILTRENPSEVTEQMRMLYYSSWLYGAIHILTSIAAYQTVPAICEKLHVPAAQAVSILRDLIAMGVVAKEKDRYLHLGKDIYLQRQAAQIHAHHLNWRMRAVERSMVSEDVHYTSTFSVSRADVSKLRDRIVELIDDQRKQVRDSGAEIACTFCCDFFEI